MSTRTSRASGQNTSTAVMNRRAEAADSLDFFPTPPWATRALITHVIGERPLHLAWDPACGRGDMVHPLQETFCMAFGSDVHDYGEDYPVHDFLQPYLPDFLPAVEFIITNPPFRLAEQFITKALEVASHGVCMLVRLNFLEGVGRYERLFRNRPPAVVAQFTERVPMVKGRLDEAASSATAYCWLVWDPQASPATTFVWIPPCRKQLERPGDYDPLPVPAAAQCEQEAML